MRMLDLFSGIGGFHKGFEQAGYTFDWVGFSEIDKYASAVYKHKFPKAEELGDIKLIQPGRDLPDHIDIVCGGFPCQAFSVAGKRKGFDDTRGTLFFEIARILRHYRDIGNPISCLVLENVKGLLSHDNGRTFAVIYRILSNLGYTIEFQLLNTRWWLPQNRERIYIVGYIGNRGRSQVFPIGENGEAIGSECGSRDAVSCIDASYYKGADGKRTMIKQIGKLNNGDAGRVFDPDGIACTLKALGGGMGAKTGLYKVPEATKKGNVRVHTTQPRSGDPSKGGHGPLSRDDGNTYCLDTGNSQAVEVRAMTEVRTNEAKELRRKYGKDPRRLKKLKERDDGVTSALTTGQSKESMVKIEILDDYNNKIREDGVTPTVTQHCSRSARKNGIKVIIEERDDNVSNSATKDSMVKINYHQKHKTQTKRIYNDYGLAPTLPSRGEKTGQNSPIINSNTFIRRLTPVECMRLQGFSDNHNKYGEIDGKVVEMSDTQRYKQAGNAVTVDVVQAVAERIRPLFEDNERV